MFRRNLRVCRLLATLLCAAHLRASGGAGSEPGAAAVRTLLSGEVKRLGPALKERGIPASEEMDAHIVLESRDGEWTPILADWRGRAFYQDERLRDRPVELVGFRRPGMPYLQVLMIFARNDAGERVYVDYWCDICSIPMYEIKPCECCQGEIRLRLEKRDLPADLQEPAADR